MSPSRAFFAIFGAACCVLAGLLWLVPKAAKPGAPATSKVIVKVPVARNGKPPQNLPGEVIINLKTNGTVELEKTALTLPQLQEKLTAIEQLYPEQSVVVRGAENVPYKFVVGVLDTCRAAKLTNIAFATNRPDQKN